MTLIELLTTSPAPIPLGIGRVNRCLDIDDHETGEDDNCQHWMECEDEADDDDLFNRDGPNPMACCFKCGHAVHSGECVNVAPNA